AATLRAVTPARPAATSLAASLPLPNLVAVSLLWPTMRASAPRVPRADPAGSIHAALKGRYRKVPAFSVFGFGQGMAN
ncbi:hypothetical protein, partial [Acidovorax sp.]|uniref:hypothetical protein n=1 Tax=Acidovorax sp. TaxID=1872122 RepID=UPI0025C42D05